jgi:hypothetical protein
MFGFGEQPRCLRRITTESEIVLVHAMKAYGGVELQLCLFFALAIHRYEWAASGLSHFTSVETPGTYQTEIRVGLGTDGTLWKSWLHITSCIRANNSNVEIVKYLIN